MKLGLIGCGRIAQLAHLRILPRLPGVELAAIADIDNEKLNQAKRLVPAANGFTDYNDLLAIPEIKAVVVCLPNNLHAEATIAALNFKKDVYIEKPLTTSLKDAENIVKTWESKKDLVAMIGFHYRFHKTYTALKQMIQSGKFKRPILVQTSFATAGEYLPSWKQSRSTGGGVLLDLACHHIDLFRFLFEQEVTEVFAKIWTHRTEADCGLLLLSFSNGLRTQSFFSLCSIEENRFEIYDDTGKLGLETLLSDRWEILDPKLTGVRVKRLWNIARSFALSPYLSRKNSDEAFLSPYRESLIHFTEAVKGNRNLRPDLSDALENVRVIQAAEESANTGKAIRLEHNQR